MKKGLFDRFFDLVWSFAKGFLKMLGLGGGILFALVLIWYVLPEELKSWVPAFMFCGFLFCLGAGLNKIRGERSKSEFKKRYVVKRLEEDLVG
mgnify:CR=1 FL=1